MKNVFSMIAVAAFATAVVACGPSKEEMERREQARLDSIAAVQQAQQDSIAAAMAEQERLAAEAADTTKADTSAAATSTVK